MKTTVVNIRRSEYDVYIGREGHGQDGYWGNPFSAMKDGGRENAIALYQEYFLNRLRIDPTFIMKVQFLRGKRLGCFCAPKPCHGDIIAKYLDGTMKVLVCGGRHWTDKRIIFRRLLELPSNVIIIEGGCEGADLLAREVALEIGLEVVEFPAVWKKYGKPAGIMRNLKMLNTQPHLVIAFHGDLKNSRGTKHMVTEAKKRGIKVEVVDGNVS